MCMQKLVWRPNVKQYCTVKTASKFNRTIIERDKIDTATIQIHGEYYM